MSYIEWFIFCILFLGLFVTTYYTIKLMNELDEIVVRLKKNIVPIKKHTKPSLNPLTALDNLPKRKP